MKQTEQERKKENDYRRRRYRLKTIRERTKKQREFTENIEFIHVAGEKFDYFWTKNELEYFFQLWRSEEIIQLSGEERLIILSEKMKRSQYDVAILILDLGVSSLL